MAPALLMLWALSTSLGRCSGMTREQVEGKHSACVLREASHKYDNIQEEKRAEGRRMLRARMSASENVCSPAAGSEGPAVPGTAPCVCVRACSELGGGVGVLACRV